MTWFGILHPILARPPSPPVRREVTVPGEGPGHPRPFHAILPEEAQFHVLSFLTPDEMVHSAMVCRGLGRRSPEEPRWDAQFNQYVSPFVTWSIVEEAARLAMGAAATDDERDQLPLVREHNWIQRYNEFLKLREPLSFDLLYGDVAPTNEGRSEVRATLVGANCHAAVSAHVMRGGVHYASFEITGDGVVGVGVVPGMHVAEKSPRPVYGHLFRDIDGKAVGTVKMCTFNCDMGRGTWSDGHAINEYTLFPRTERAGSGDVVCLRLSLRKGTLTVFKNGKRLGTMKRGLRGEFSWCAYLCTKPGWTRPSVRIIRGTSFPDAPPTG